MSGRIRTLKPEILEDERTARLSHAAWRLFVSLIMLSDDYGNFRANPDHLRGAAFWGRPVDDGGSVGGIDALLAELATPDVDGEKGLIALYVVRGQRYGHLNGWSKNQRVQRPGSPRVPGPKEGESVDLRTDSGRPPESVRIDAGVAPEVLTTDLRSPITISDQRSPTTAPSASAEVPVERTATKSKVGSRGTRIAADWKPSAALLAWCHEQRVDGEAHVAEFIDHWASVSGAKGTKLDWDATFRNRIRDLIAWDRALPYEPPPEAPKPIVRVPPPPEALAAMRELEARSARDEHIDVGENAAAWQSKSTGGAS